MLSNHLPTANAESVFATLKTDKRRFELKEFGSSFESDTAEKTGMNRTWFQGYITDRAEVLSSALHVKDLL
jgi:hypothetical protein